MIPPLIVLVEVEPDDVVELEWFAGDWVGAVLAQVRNEVCKFECDPAVRRADGNFPRLERDGAAVKGYWVELRLFQTANFARGGRVCSVHARVLSGTQEGAIGFAVTHVWERLVTDSEGADVSSDQN